MSQSISNNIKCIFSNKGFDFEEFGGEELGITEDQFENINGKECTVLDIATYTELGNKDFEYYNIVFEDGIELEAVSGYHLIIK